MSQLPDHKQVTLSDLQCVEEMKDYRTTDDGELQHVFTSYRVSDRDAFRETVQGQPFHAIFNLTKGQVLWVSDTTFIVSTKTYFRKFKGDPDWPFEVVEPNYRQHIRESGTTNTLIVGALGSGWRYHSRCSVESIRNDNGYILSLFRGLQTPVTLYLNFRGFYETGSAPVTADALAGFLESNNSPSLELIEMKVEDSIMGRLLSIPFESLEIGDVALPTEVSTDNSQVFSGGPTSIVLDGCRGDWNRDIALFGRCPRVTALRCPVYYDHYYDDLSFLSGTSVDKLVFFVEEAAAEASDFGNPKFIKPDWRVMWNSVSESSQISTTHFEPGIEQYWRKVASDDRLVMAVFLASTLRNNTRLLDITGELDKFLGEEAFAGLILPILDRNRILALRIRLQNIVQQNDGSECRKMLVRELEREPTNTNINLLFTTLKEFMACSSREWQLVE